MIADFFKRLRPSSAPPGEAGISSATLGHSSTSSAARVTAIPQTPAPARAPDPDARELHGWLELDVRTRVAALHQTLARADRATDAPRFLDGLVESFEAIVRQPPLAAQRALTVTRDTNAHSSHLVSLVEGDPGLGQALRRYANSAYCATGGDHVVSLHGAVQRVGTSGVRNVVLTIMVDGILCRPGTAFQRSVNLAWEHLVRVAPIARHLAPFFSAAPDEAFAIGLLHDVGKLVVFDRLGELRKTLRRGVILPSSLLSAVLRSLHEPLGRIAALQWGLGAGVAHAIANHHRSPVPETYDPRGELLFVAERVNLARYRGASLDVDRWWRDGLLCTPRQAVEPAMATLPDTGSEEGGG